VQLASPEAWGPGPYYYVASLALSNINNLEGFDDSAWRRSSDEESLIVRLDGGDLIMIFRGSSYGSNEYALMAMSDDSSRLLAEFVTEASMMDVRLIES